MLYVAIGHVNINKCMLDDQSANDISIRLVNTNMIIVVLPFLKKLTTLK
jgi:hypothetical protein